jgi:hypothetical protein
MDASPCASYPIELETLAGQAALTALAAIVLAALRCEKSLAKADTMTIVGR